MRLSTRRPHYIRAFLLTDEPHNLTSLGECPETELGGVIGATAHWHRADLFDDENVACRSAARSYCKVHA